GTSLIDVESGTAVLTTVSVSKSDLDIYTAASATFEAADGTHVVGDITGSGTTRVDSGASLTAASISQGTLTIGSGTTFAIQAIPGGPLSDTITAVPEPSTLALLAAAFLMLAYSRERKWGK
ncbi:MAG: PEP-CTERM sorting domain-containing protein, partial [Thermoguttaceae bacterium]